MDDNTSYGERYLKDLSGGAEIVRNRECLVFRMAWFPHQALMALPPPIPLSGQIGLRSTGGTWLKSFHADMRRHYSSISSVSQKSISNLSMLIMIKGQSQPTRCYWCLCQIWKWFPRCQDLSRKQMVDSEGPLKRIKWKGYLWRCRQD